jgi:hypothetical protein
MHDRSYSQENEQLVIVVSILDHLSSDYQHNNTDVESFMLLMLQHEGLQLGRLPVVFTGQGFSG